MVKDAKNKYGDCEVVSKTETSDKTEVIVRDKAQEFEYKLSSKMSGMYIDGSYFGSLPSCSDTFYVELVNYTMAQGQTELDGICQKYGIEYECRPFFYDELKGTASFLCLTIPTTVTEEQGEKIAEEVANVFQQYNVKNRLDGVQIRLEHDTEWFTANYGKYKPNGNNPYPDETYSSSGMHIECQNLST